jgi:hypothetical protein
MVNHEAMMIEANQVLASVSCARRGYRLGIGLIATAVQSAGDPSKPFQVANPGAGADASPSNSDVRSGPGPAPICLPQNSVQWANRANGQEIACVENATERPLGEPTKAHAGTSPWNLLAPTVGDLLVRASSGRSRGFSVSFKDRGAILPGGQAGKAFWFSAATGRFVSSTYCHLQLPAWVERWNQKSPIEAWRGGTWDLLLDRLRWH